VPLLRLRTFIRHWAAATVFSNRQRAGLLPGCEQWHPAFRLGFDDYVREWVAYADAISAQVPAARFGGPDTALRRIGSLVWAADRARLGKRWSHSVATTMRRATNNPKVTTARLLAGDPTVTSSTREIVAVADAYQLSYHMTEGNSCYRGGKPGMSNAFASSLWPEIACYNWRAWAAAALTSMEATAVSSPPAWAITIQARDSRGRKVPHPMDSIRRSPPSRTSTQRLDRYSMACCWHSSSPEPRWLRASFSAATM